MYFGFPLRGIVIALGDLLQVARNLTNKMGSVVVPQDKIGKLIGPRGAVINKIRADTGMSGMWQQKKRLHLSVGKKRKDYTFRRQLNEKPSVILGCPAQACYIFCICLMACCGMRWHLMVCACLIVSGMYHYLGNHMLAQGLVNNDTHYHMLLCRLGSLVVIAEKRKVFLSFLISQLMHGRLSSACDCSSIRYALGRNFM